MAQKSQYRTKLRLKKRQQKLLADFEEHSAKFRQWHEVLGRPLSSLQQIFIAGVIADAGYVPDKDGYPVREGPSRWKGYEVLAFIDDVVGSHCSVFTRMGVSVNSDLPPPNPFFEDSRSVTLAEAADALEKASLAWAGAIGESELSGLAYTILADCDLDAYWSRPGVGLDKAGVRARWERDGFLVDQISLRDQLRRAGGK